MDSDNVPFFILSSRDDDKPYFRRALIISLAIGAACIAMVVARRFQLGWMNKKREEKWKLLTNEEKDEYNQHEAKKLGDRALNYRYIW